MHVFTFTVPSLSADTVPSILKDALQLTSQNIESELATMLQRAYQLTGQARMGCVF